MSSQGPYRGANTQPDVSIVMPVFNKLDLTKVCVESILAIDTACSKEIIVVDNGSSDGTAQWLNEQEAVGNLRRVDNPENLGFAQGCNLGAAQARGRHHLFLNNDMEVIDGWLDPMVTCLDQDPTVGIAGACLLYADNTLQHGGVAMVDFRAKTPPVLEGTHLGYRKPVDFPGVRKNQIVRVVTGACLMIRPKLFTEIGGFDEAYWNGNEDVDLCLKAGELGWKVVYMGDSLLYHYESQSGPERWVQTQANIERLTSVWTGRAEMDFVKSEDGGFKATAHNQIRTYVSPGLRWTRPQPDLPHASVIVLTWNALDYTRKCVSSLLEHTDPRHELIFVDNGSAPDTLDYLTQLEADHAQVKVIRNGTNLGFAGGNNVGLAAATGDYLCLLNSDTVVTAGWLDRLMQPLVDDPRLGLTGPVTNSITGGQKLPAVDYDEDALVGLASFADRVATEKAGQLNPALWVVGFCLMMRRDLLLRAGGLDEGFGLGNFEDTDFCLRSFLAGYNAAIVPGCFIHHFGSRSFVENGLAYAQVLEEKFEVFRRKWDLAVDARETGDFQLERLINRGFVPGLHFQPLPPSPHFEPVRPAPWQAEQWVLDGEADFHAGNLDSAKRIFAALLNRVPDHSRAGNDLACVLWQTDPEGDGVQAARVILEGILAREPGNRDAQWNLAEIDGKPLELPPGIGV